MRALCHASESEMATDVSTDSAESGVPHPMANTAKIPNRESAVFILKLRPAPLLLRRFHRGGQP